MTQLFKRNGRWVTLSEIRSAKNELKSVEKYDKSQFTKKIADIIIPHHNRHDHLKRCLEGIDNSLFYIHIESGGTFAENCNNGAKNAKTDTLIFLNDDVETETDILIELALDKRDYCGLSQLIGSTKYTGIGWTKSEDPYVRFNASTGTRDFFIPSGYCMKFSKKAWKKLGGLNEQFKNGGEDQDIGFRALEAGMSVGFIDRPMVHKHSQSAGRHNHVDENVELLNKLWPNEKIEQMISKRRAEQIKNIPVLFTTFNRLDYTKRSIKSLLDSEVKKIIIIDNASTDGTQEFLKTITDKRVQVVYNKENGGVRGAMQQFFDLFPNEEWVAKIDNDTIVPKDWLSKLLKCATENGLDIVQAKHGITKETHPKGWAGIREVCTKIADGVYKSNCVGGSGTLIRRQVVDELPESDWVLGGWTHWQKRHLEVTKGFCEHVEITLFDTDENGAKYSDYPEYYKFTKRIK